MKILAEQMDSLLSSSMAWYQVFYLENVQDLLNEPILSKIWKEHNYFQGFLSLRKNAIIIIKASSDW